MITTSGRSPYDAAYGDTVPPRYALNRPAFVTMLRAAADERLHGVRALAGPAGTVVELAKTARVPLSRTADGAMEVEEGRRLAAGAAAQRPDRPARRPEPDGRHPPEPVSA